MKQIWLSPPDVGVAERRLLLDAFDSNWIAPVGPHLDAFEREVAAAVGVPYAVAVSSGTAALHLALIAAGVRRGDRVITSTLTFAATANVALYVGAQPVFVDVSRDTWTMDPVLLEEELEACARRRQRVGAIITVDLYGQCADYNQIARIADKFGVPVIEDAAEALGATYRGRSAGAFGRCAAFSFNGNKIITAGGGGMLVTHDRDLAARVKHLATQAREPFPFYQHLEVGYNYRMSNLLAAVGRGQLTSLTRKLARRRQVNDRYRAAFSATPAITFMPEAPYGRGNCWLTAMVVDAAAFGADCERIRQHLESRNIEARRIWKPLHLQPAFHGCSVRGGSVATGLFMHGLCVPSGSNLSAVEQERVVNGIFEAAEQRQTAAAPQHAMQVVA